MLRTGTPRARWRRCEAHHNSPGFADQPPHPIIDLAAVLVVMQPQPPPPPCGTRMFPRCFPQQPTMRPIGDKKTESRRGPCLGTPA